MEVTSSTVTFASGSRLDLALKEGGAYICASGTSPDTPAPPYTCIAQSATLQAILAAATLIIAIWETVTGGERRNSLHVLNSKQIGLCSV